MFPSHEICIWDTEGIEPTRDKPRSHTVYDLNHSVNRVYTIGTECSHHMISYGLRP